MMMIDRETEENEQMDEKNNTCWGPNEGRHVSGLQYLLRED